MIDEFQKLNEIKISSGGDVRRVILWNNDDICIDNAAVFHRSLYRGGVSCIDHIAKQSGDFLSIDELRQKYPRVQINPLTYQGLISSIPFAWKQLIKNEEGYEEVSNDQQIRFCIKGKQISINQIKARDIYKCFIGKIKPTAELRWEKEGYRFTDWGEVYDLPYKCTTSTRIQSLHFRIVNRYIPTLKFLHIRNVTETPLCPLCSVDESISHFLFHCQDVNPIWSTMLPKLREIFHLNNDFVACKTVLFGYPKAKPVVNLFILLVKQYVVTCKLRETRRNVNIESLKCNIMQYFKTEKYISKYSLRLTAEQFQAKWEKVLEEDGYLALNAIFQC